MGAAARTNGLTQPASNGRTIQPPSICAHGRLPQTGSARYRPITEEARTPLTARGGNATRPKGAYIAAASGQSDPRRRPAWWRQLSPRSHSRPAPAKRRIVAGALAARKAARTGKQSRVAGRRRVYLHPVNFDDEGKRARAVLDLLRRYLPATVDLEGQITDNDWRLVAPGLVGGAASIVESIFCLPPPRQAPSAEILTRSLIDYVITFAWLAVPEKRQERLNAFEESFYNESEGLDAKYTTEFQGKNQPTPKRSKRIREPSDRQKVIAHYTKLIETGKMPAALLTDRMRVWIAERRKIIGAKPMPVLLDRALKADEYWIHHSEAVASSPFANLWVVVFAHESAVAHATPTAVSRMSFESDGALHVGEATAESIKSTPYGRAVVLLGLMLHVGSQALGWPSTADLDAAFAA
jgi:hypothetical protein